ncbi:DUF1194 domain-containing protein [Rhodobacteraceae bacterium 2CG4]|uniref:DUF1194 domain-containing protein n=1 Tax=Halovulum marinum TaxID=2662447 RepID=A0A6L5YUP2_9RHOB|nr:DUF1194 domain-containing protein [Halovulum marinum]MSU87998.1 DUF1194 domain-containing protein [Halovulum marinum]
MRILALPIAMLASLAAAGPAFGCRLALLLAVDVSGSIDSGEYRFQMDGLAEALEAPDVADALWIEGATVAVVQWSGAADQAVTIPWRRMAGPGDVARLAAQVRAAPRRWTGGKTALGDALAFMAPLFEQVPECARRVIDISGDGITNDGRETRAESRAAERRGVVVNGLAIDRIGISVARFYEQFVRAGDGSFVERATGYSDYPRAIRRKLYREVVVPAS